MVVWPKTRKKSSAVQLRIRRIRLIRLGTIRIRQFNFVIALIPAHNVILVTNDRRRRTRIMQYLTAKHQRASPNAIEVQKL